MLRIFLLRILSIGLVVYIVYFLSQFLITKQKLLWQKKTMRDLEKADYDKKEWEKIKDELKKK
ncbi:MAG: hypothetical protein KKH94_04795 [Candidatus Omnitrophica bacterium]|nr:hypothetical protein [Candidatus Omnitrophota bacterium]